MDKVLTLYGYLMTADGWKTTKHLLRHGEVDDLCLGLKIRIWMIPNFLAKIISPLVGYIYSPVLAGLMTNPFNCPKSWQLWERYNERLVLIKEILEDWEKHQVDVIIAPGMGMPSQKLGYPAYEFPVIGYTCAYNLLNFPAGSVPVNSF
jgi:fatty acid amide hydrolase